MSRIFALIAPCALILAAACGGDVDNTGGSAGGGGSGGDGSDRDERYDADVSFSTDVTYSSPVGPGPRGFLDVRGLIHEHSPHSHDACDDNPKDSDGNFDTQCLLDFYEGLCSSLHDFVMLTDHPTFFAEVPFPETLLYDAARDDQLIMRDKRPVANLVAREPNRRPLILAGSESDEIMPVGIEAHPAELSVYSRLDAKSASELEQLGGVVLVSHTEGYTGESLATLPITGFEMYNLHANLNNALADGSVTAVLASILDPNEMLHPDLVLLTILAEDPVYLDTWARALALGAHRVTMMATDAHRNSLNFPLSDGERIDSWRRMNRWFSNHLLLPGDDGNEWDDRDLKEALRAGRLYGVFEILGYARGFDFYAETGPQTVEMGGTASLADGVTLRVMRPSVRGLEDAAQPSREVRVLQATTDGWVEVARGDGDVSMNVASPGAYRVEVRMRPQHLRANLGSFAELADSDFVWIYGNAIYVTE
jgi:hypothetical protein